MLLLSPLLTKSAETEAQRKDRGQHTVQPPEVLSCTVRKLRHGCASCPKLMSDIFISLAAMQSMPTVFGLQAPYLPLTHCMWRSPRLVTMTTIKHGWPYNHMIRFQNAIWRAFYQYCAREEVGASGPSWPLSPSRSNPQKPNWQEKTSLAQSILGM